MPASGVLEPGVLDSSTLLAFRSVANADRRMGNMGTSARFGFTPSVLAAAPNLRPVSAPVSNADAGVGSPESRFMMRRDAVTDFTSDGVCSAADGR